jgi:DNA-binding winged helix-turn-helix (wHTH) protein
MSDTPILGPRPLQQPGTVRYRVGDLTIDVGRQRVMRGESVIALPRLSYELLMALVRAAPNLLSLDALMEQVWPKVVVSPETLSQRVKLLRDALGDDPRAPRYVEGLRGRGYRLIPTVESDDQPGAAQVTAAPVEASVVAQDLPATTIEAAAPSAALPQGMRRPLLFWGSIITVLMLLGGVFLLRQLMHGQSPKTRTSIEVVAVQPRAVAVLPFDNLSPEPNNDYIAL